MSHCPHVFTRSAVKYPCSGLIKSTPLVPNFCLRWTVWLEQIHFLCIRAGSSRGSARNFKFRTGMWAPHPSRTQVFFLQIWSYIRIILHNLCRWPKYLTYFLWMFDPQISCIRCHHRGTWAKAAYANLHLIHPVLSWQLTSCWKHFRKFARF